MILQFIFSLLKIYTLTVLLSMISGFIYGFYMHAFNRLLPAHESLFKAQILIMTPIRWLIVKFASKETIYKLSKNKFEFEQLEKEIKSEKKNYLKTKVDFIDIIYTHNYGQDFAAVPIDLFDSRCFCNLESFERALLEIFKSGEYFIHPNGIKENIELSKISTSLVFFNREPVAPIYDNGWNGKFYYDLHNS